MDLAIVIAHNAVLIISGEQEATMNEKPFESSIYGRVMTLKEAAEYLHTSYSTVY